MSGQEGAPGKLPAIGAEIERGARTRPGQAGVGEGCWPGLHFLSPRWSLSNSGRYFSFLCFPTRMRMWAPRFGWAGSGTPSLFCSHFPRRGQAGRLASMGFGQQSTRGTGHLPGPADVPPPALGPLPGQTTLDQGFEALARRVGRNLGPPQCSPHILPVHWPWILTNLIGGR